MTTILYHLIWGRFDNDAICEILSHFWRNRFFLIYVDTPFYWTTPMVDLLQLYNTVSPGLLLQTLMMVLLNSSPGVDHMNLITLGNCIIEKVYHTKFQKCAHRMLCAQYALQWFQNFNNLASIKMVVRDLRICSNSLVLWCFLWWGWNIFINFLMI